MSYGPNTVTIVLPCSRPEFLTSVFSSLELMECNRDLTNLLTIVDGNVELFEAVRNFTQKSKFAQRLSVHFKNDAKLSPYNIMGRRMQIAKIHNFAQQFLHESEFVFLTEDDTVCSPQTVKQLLIDYSYHPYAGLISGLQLGRHGISHIGAWQADDVYEPTIIESIPKPSGQDIIPVDATGFYACMTRTETYKGHTFSTFDNNSFGTDVDYGIRLRRTGYTNYIDPRINTIHKTVGRDITLQNTATQIVRFTKTPQRWEQAILPP